MKSGSYVPNTHKYQWDDPKDFPVLEPKENLQLKRVILLICWDSQGIIHREFLLSNTTIDSELYSKQLQNLKVALQVGGPERRRARQFYDRVKPHMATITHQKLEKVGWEILLHSLYSPALASSDYHLLWLLLSHLVQKHFDDQMHLQSDLETFSSLSFLRTAF